MPGTEEEVIRIGKQLEKMVSKNASDLGNAFDLLKSLKELPMTLEVLQVSRIGMSVNSLRKQSSNEEVISLAKSLIKSWKKLLPAPSSSKSSNKDNQDSSRDSPTDLSQDGNSINSNNDNSSSSQSKSSSKFQVPKTNDAVREKCREMLTNALKTPLGDIESVGTEELGEPEEIAATIEDCIFTEFTNTEAKYKTRVRSRVANLKDVRNPILRQQVLCGSIPPEKIANMTAEEMASDRLKELRRELTKEAIREAQMSTTGGTKTSLLKCGKCKKRNCTYNQVQTRSADEPMTTFVFCNECGNRWKFC
ncbi:transcription elongation factor A protein 1-like [Saccoglossus kowalevskii]